MSPPKSGSSSKSKAPVPTVIVPAKAAEDPVDSTTADSPPPPGSPPPQLIAEWLTNNGIPIYNQHLSKPPVKKSTTSKQASLPSTGKTSVTASNVLPSELQQPTSKQASLPSTGKTNVTASNVLPAELEKHLNWSFRSSFDSLYSSMVAQLPISCGPLIQALESLFFFKDQGQWKPQGYNDNNPMLYLPSEWKSKLQSVPDQNPFSEEPKQRVIVDFLSLHDPQNVLVKWKPEKEIKGFTFSDPNIFNMKNPYIEEGAIAYALAHFLQMPAFKMQHASGVGELGVERLVGSVLTGFFNVPGCETTSNRPVTFPEEMSCFGSHPKPDYATRISEPIEHLKDNTMNPITLVGEGKAKFILSKTGESGSKNQNQFLGLPLEESRLRSMEWSPRMAAQLAFAAYPSLCIIITSLITKWKSSPPKKKSKREDYQIPDYAVIYGIGYAATGVLIYAFFPYVMEWDATSNFPKKWGFASILVTSAFRQVFLSKKLRDRLHLARVLLLIQQHAKRLKDEMKSAAFPEEFRA